MLKNKTALSLSPLALLTLAACGGSGGTTASNKTVIAQKGPLNLATAYLDYDDDGVWDQLTEPGGMTGVDGSATFSTALAATTAQTTTGYDLKIAGSANTMDMSAGTVFDSVLSAPSTSTMITPVTTMVAESGLTPAQVVKVLGLPAGLDPLTFNAFSTTLSDADKLTALKVEKTAQKTMAVLQTFETAATSSGMTAAVAAKAALASVVGMFTAANTLYEAAEATTAGTGTLVTFSAADVDAVKVQMDTAITAAVADGTMSAANKLVFDAQVANNVISLKNVVAEITSIPETPANYDLADHKDTFAVVSVLVAQVETATAAVLAIQTANTVNGTALALTPSPSLSPADITASISNPGPTDMTLSALSISEDAASLVVGTVTTTDTSDAGTAAVEAVTAVAAVAADVANGIEAVVAVTGVTAVAAVAATAETGHTYSIATVAGTDGALFSIDAATGVLSLLAQPDYETKTSYTVAIKTEEAGANPKSYVETFTISVTDVVESGGFGISSDTVTWTDYDPATSADITNQFMTTTTGSQVTMGTGAMRMNQTNLLNFTDGSTLTTGKSPTLSFTLDTIPTGSGNATVTATVIEGSDGTRSGTEDMISLTVNVAYNDGELSMPAGTATGSFDKGDGTSVSFTLDNPTVHIFNLTAGNAVTGLPSTLDVKLGNLYQAFTDGAGSAGVLHTGTYSIAIETTLPLQNTANETVTKFTGAVELVTSTTKNQLYGTDGADTVAGTVAAEVIIAGAGKDTISTGGGADFIVMHTGFGSTTLANASTVTDFTNGTDKFALDGLIFTELTVAPDATDAADTVVSVTATGEYLITIADLASGYINAGDFVLVDVL